MIISTKKKEEVRDLGQQEFDKLFTDLYKEAINKAIHIQKMKNATYNGDTISYKEYTAMKEMYPALLYGKALRMVSILDGSEQNFESLEDTMLDMINYAAFSYATFRMYYDTEEPHK